MLKAVWTRLLKYPLVVGAGSYGLYINGIEDVDGLKAWYDAYAKPHLVQFCPELSDKK